MPAATKQARCLLAAQTNLYVSEALELRSGLRSFRIPHAGVAELADALDSKSVAVLGSDRLIATLLPD